MSPRLTIPGIILSMGDNEMEYCLLGVVRGLTKRNIFLFPSPPPTPLLVRVGGSEGNKKIKSIIIAKHLSYIYNKIRTFLFR